MDRSQLKRLAAMREIPSDDANALIGAELMTFITDSGNTVRFYDLNALPAHLHTQYDKDNASGNRPLVDGYTAVWPNDFECWRTFYLTGKPRPFF